MFEQASRLRLRFKTKVGHLSTEELWNLPLSEGVANLNDLAKDLRKQVKEDAEEDFVKPKNFVDKMSSLRFDIVKHIISVRLNEIEDNKRKVEDRQKRDQILEVIANKQAKELSEKSIGELKKML